MLERTLGGVEYARAEPLCGVETDGDVDSVELIGRGSWRTIEEKTPCRMVESKIFPRCNNCFFSVTSLIFDADYVFRSYRLHEFHP